MAPVLSEATNHWATLRRNAPCGPAVCDRGSAFAAEAVPASRSGGAALRWADVSNVSADGALGASHGGSHGASDGGSDGGSHGDGGRSVGRVSSLA